MRRSRQCMEPGPHVKARHGGAPRGRPSGSPSKYHFDGLTLIRETYKPMATTTFPTRDDFAALLNQSLGGENETFEGKVVKGTVTAK